MTTLRICDLCNGVLAFDLRELIDVLASAVEFGRSSDPL